MSEKRDTHTEEQPTKPRRWRPSKRQVLWAIGMMVALATLAILIVKIANLYPDIWQALSRERVAMLIGFGVALVVVIVLLAIGGTSLGWTGFGDKTLWDWLQLLSALAIPIVLAAAGLWFTAQQDQRQQKIEDQRVTQAQKIENQRADTERKLAEQRTQDEALQSYLDKMSSLLLEKDLRSSEEDTEVRTLARARTVTVIQRLDEEHNRILVRFLNEAGLTGAGQSSLSLLAEVELSGVTLSGVDLSDADLSTTACQTGFSVCTDLSGADLSHTSLHGADLSGVILQDTNLSDAGLATFGNSANNADLNHADLERADLSSANLYNANLHQAFLLRADLSRTYLDDANLSRAYLKNANLSRATLGNADLSKAYLRGADLTEAKFLPFPTRPGMVDKKTMEQLGPDLSGADLSGADLSGATGVTKELLEDQAKSLSDATMPNGQKMPLEPELGGLGEIPAGANVTHEFESAFRFEVGEGWAVGVPVKADEVFIEYEQKGGQLIFTHPTRVYDPSNLSELKKVPAPEDVEEWVSWFQRHPNLDTSKPAPASVGDASGMRIDVTVNSTPGNYPKEVCGDKPCVPLYTLSRGGEIFGSEGSKDRFFIVDIGGETVLIDVAAPIDRFGEFLPKAQKVLNSVEWKGG